MTAEDKVLGSRWFEEVWNKGRREAIAEMMSADAVLHDGAVELVGLTGFYAYFDRLSAALSNVHVTVQDTIAGEDNLCIRWSCTAKHTGPGLGIDATGKDVRITGITIFRIAGGMIVEGWQNWDMLGLLEQIRGGERAATYIG